MLQQQNESAPVNPVHCSIATLDQDMQAILQRTDLSNEEKVGQYNQVLQRYLECHDHLCSPPPPSVAASKDIQTEVLEMVPLKLRHKAATLLEHIKWQLDMSWNEQGELIFNGKWLKVATWWIWSMASCVIKKTFQTHAWQEFAHALRQRNITQDLVGNADQWKLPKWSRYSTPLTSKVCKFSCRPRIKKEPVSVKKDIKWET